MSLFANCRCLYRPIYGIFNEGVGKLIREGNDAFVVGALHECIN